MIDYAERRARVQQAMRAASLDLLAVSPGDNMYYLLGYHPVPDERPCYLLLTPAGAGMLVPDVNATQAQAHVDLPLAIYADADGPGAALDRLAAGLGLVGARSVALDDTMRADFVLLLLGRLPGAVPRLASEVLAPLRMRKEAAELALLQENAAAADRAMEAAFAAVRPGVSEAAVAEAVKQAFAAAGAEQVDFAIVGGGANSAFPHHHTSRYVLQPGDAVVIDIGARMHGYRSDITRMAFLGEPTGEYARVHAVVEQAVQAALAAVRPGVPAKAVDQAARGVIEAAGYGAYFTHRTGHGLGLSGHEPPYITGTNELTLAEGMVFSIEPGIYLPGRFGVRLEEIVTVTADGARTFSRLPRAVYVVR